MDERKLTYSDVDRLCRRHLEHRYRIELSGPRVVRYERRESQRFRPAFPSVNAYLMERIDFDRAFKRLYKRHQEVLVGWYGRGDMTQAELAKAWGVSPRTVRRMRREAVEALVNVFNT